MAFFHIPVPEFKYMIRTVKIRGFSEDNIDCSRKNTGLFAKMKENGNIRGIYVGHDHSNDFIGQYKGVELAYARKTGYNSYGPGKNGYRNKGARVIVLTEKKEGEKVIVEHETYLIEVKLGENEKVITVEIGEEYRVSWFSYIWWSIINFFRRLFGMEVY